MHHQTTQQTHMNISIIGAGAMGGAVARGLVSAGYAAAGEITVANPSASRLEPLKALGCVATPSNTGAVAGADVVVIAVKPWILPAVAAEIAGHIPASCREVCVIVAGIKGEDILAMLPGEFALTVAMPNTAMTVGRSMTFLTPLRGEAEASQAIFGVLGQTMVIEERLLPGATALASCGIAYAMRYVRAASEGGVELGFRASEAQRIVAATLEGAVALLAAEGAHPETEIDKVTTPGGLTIRGLNAMEKNGFTTAVIEGLKASVK